MFWDWGRQNLLPTNKSGEDVGEMRYWLAVVVDLWGRRRGRAMCFLLES